MLLETDEAAMVHAHQQPQRWREEYSIVMPFDIYTKIYVCVCIMSQSMHDVQLAQSRGLTDYSVSSFDTSEMWQRCKGMGMS